MREPSNQSFYRYRGDGGLHGTYSDTPISMRGEVGRYLADGPLTVAVNTALAVQQPLLVTGEPGTGKSALAWSIASELGLGEPLVFNTRSDSQARDLLYVFDHLLRYYHAQVHDPRAEKVHHYVRFMALGLAVRSATQRVVLIDEVDKAQRDFPNDILAVLDNMAFEIPELGEHFESRIRPIVIITSNSERQLPDAFLRRCVFHHIRFPESDRLRRILFERLNHLGLSQGLIDVAVERFQELRTMSHLEKRPATSEFLAWVRALIAAGVDADQLERSPLSTLPLHGALLKTLADQELLQGLESSPSGPRRR